MSPQIVIIFTNKLVQLLEDIGGKGVFISKDCKDMYAIMFDGDISSVADCLLQLQKKITALEMFCPRTGTKFNLKKTKDIVFRNGGHLKSYEKWTYCGENIEAVTFYRYLWLMFTPKLIWSQTQTCLAVQSTKALVAINRYQRRVCDMPCKDLNKIFLYYDNPYPVLWG